MKSLDLLIIDEISMVRADVLDGIDETLRRYRRDSRPFGGVQLLMIGDLHQLPPVVRQQEWNLLQEHYKTAYFFGSLALRSTDMIVIELKYIYRQSDPIFINLLNKVRNNELDNSVIETLNSRYNPDSPKDTESVITLTSHVAAAKRINDHRLTKIKLRSHKFKAEVDGTFPPHAFPNDENLEFKQGAQVMFVKNDLSEEKLFFNGKLGKIIFIDSDEITVLCEDKQEITVVPATWENTKYNLNTNTKLIDEEVVGTFTQFPLRLAWAITIHKSQGLTFDKVVIDAAAAFAHGQVYVALSRCKSFEGITLHSRIEPTSISTDQVVQSFEVQSSQNAPNEDMLFAAKRDFEQYLLRELFDFKLLVTAIRSLLNAIIEAANALHGGEKQKVVELGEIIDKDIYVMGLKFQPKLEAYFLNKSLPSENQDLMKRVVGASGYFCDQLKNKIFDPLSAFSITTDNNEARKRVASRLDFLKKEVFIKNACFETCREKFDTQKMITAKANAEIDYGKKSPLSKTKTRAPSEVKHKKLYNQLINWRNAEAEEAEIEGYKIAQIRTLIEITEVLPQSIESLKRVYGFGKKKLIQYGDFVCKMVIDYCEENNLEGDQMVYASKATKKKSPPKGATQALTISMYKNGGSIEEIAKERELAKSTIEGHLSLGVSTGELDIMLFMKNEKLNNAVAYFEKTEDKSFTIAMNKLNNNYSYGELRMVLGWMELKGDKKED